jgi:hypothetical protein
MTKNTRHLFLTATCNSHFLKKMSTPCYTLFMGCCLLSEELNHESHTVINLMRWKQVKYQNKI